MSDAVIAAAPVLEPLARMPGIWAFVGMSLAAAVGFACLSWCLAPTRMARAVSAFSTTPSRLITGGAVVLVMFLLAMLPAKLGIWGRGGGLLLLPILAFGGTGLAVSARFLGERALPESSPASQFALGLLALVLPGLSVIGLPVTIVGMAVGVGNWLSARSRVPAP